MIIELHLEWDEKAALRLLRWLAQENALVLGSRPELPLLYDSGVVYQREDQEEWCDVIQTLARGYEDCDGLCAYRTGEILARGHKAIRKGDPGYEVARKLRPRRVRAEVMFVTRTPPGERGLIHCITRYRLGGRWFYDDPSKRLGMHDGVIDAVVMSRWHTAARRRSAA